MILIRWQSLTPLLAFLSGSFVMLVTVPAVAAPPGAGSILRQIQPVLPATPSPIEPGLIIQQEDGFTLPPSAPFMVNAIQITGNENIDSMTLNALVADAEGKSLTLPQLGEIATRLTDFYHSRGYPLARAAIPAQSIHAGVVQIVVIEAHYGKILFDNFSRVRDGLLQSTLAPLQSGEVISQAEMNRSLLLLSDIPGTIISTTLKSGATIGTSDMVVEVASGSLAAGNLVLDNYGDRYTGRTRVGGTFSIIDPLRQGDVLNISGLSTGSALNYGRISYEFLSNGYGTRLGGAFSLLHYKLEGGAVAAIGAHGTALVKSLWTKQPILRGQEVNLFGQIQFDHKDLRDHVDAGAIRSDRHLDNWTVSFNGDVRDSLLAGGVNSWNLGWTAGRVSFDDNGAKLADASTARTRGGFSKWNMNLSRLQDFSPGNMLQLSLLGQWASDNLDASEKMSAGGPYTVRAYDMGALSGDSGILASAEFRHVLASAWYGQWQLVAFLDSARLNINRSAWTAGINNATLSGAGLGINWTGPMLWTGSAYVATPVGLTPSMVADRSTLRGWIEIGKAF